MRLEPGGVDPDVLDDPRLVPDRLDDQLVRRLHEGRRVFFELGQSRPHGLDARHLLEACDLPDWRGAIAPAERLYVDIVGQGEGEHDQRPVAFDSLAPVVGLEVGFPKQVVEDLREVRYLPDHPDRIE